MLYLCNPSMFAYRLTDSISDTVTFGMYFGQLFALPENWTKIHKCIISLPTDMGFYYPEGLTGSLQKSRQVSDTNTFLGTVYKDSLLGFVMTFNS